MFFEWAYLMELGSDNAAYREMENWYKEFRADPDKWSPGYFAWHVCNRRHEYVNGTIRSYRDYLVKKGALKY